MKWIRPLCAALCLALTLPPLAAGEATPDLSLPVLSIETEGGALPGDADMAATLTLTEPDGSGGTRTVTTPIEINLRGNTSRRYPKKSYRVKIVDEWGQKRDLSIAGLRADDDWILNPMYSDSSKIREALGYWLWSQINSRGQAAASSRVAYAEVVLNGEYWGLYGVQERVDRKQVGADKRSGVLYKVVANDRPTVQALLDCLDEAVCAGIELEYAGGGVVTPWAPAADYIALLEGEDPPGNGRLSLENTVDYGLWAMLTQARDCHFKNQFIHAAAAGGGYVLYRIPWDLNHTLGDLWNGDDEGANFTGFHLLSLTMDDAFKLAVEEGDPAFFDAVRARWAELRAGAISEERIVEYAAALHAALYPAIQRDTERWPECGMGEGNAANIRDIEGYIRDVIPRMDAWVEALGRTQEETEALEDGENMDR